MASASPKCPASSRRGDCRLSGFRPCCIFLHVEMSRALISSSGAGGIFRRLAWHLCTWRWRDIGAAGLAATIAQAGAAWHRINVSAPRETWRQRNHLGRRRAALREAAAACAARRGVSPVYSPHAAAEAAMRREACYHQAGGCRAAIKPRRSIGIGMASSKPAMLKSRARRIKAARRQATK